jgi:hypothetical protein
MEEYTTEYQDKVIEFALRNNSFELIFQWLEDNLDKSEVKSFEVLFKKWLFENQKVYHLFLKEYTLVYKRNKG